MAIYRTLHISFWQDPFVLELTPESKYFYIYLMTNSKTNQLGCYEIALKTIVDETGYSKETVETLLEKFVEKKKIIHSKKTNEILLLNWHKYSWSKSPKVEICIKKEFQLVKSEEFKSILFSLFKEHGYSMDSLWIKETETETETETKISFQQIADMYNEICISFPKLSKLSNQRKKALSARFKEYSIDDFRRLFTLAESSSFLKGRNNRDWRATFDWLIKDANMAKVLDGNYNTGKEQVNGTKPVSGTTELSYAEKQLANGYVPKQHNENPFG